MFQETPEPLQFLRKKAGVGQFGDSCYCMDYLRQFWNGELAAAALSEQLRDLTAVWIEEDLALLVAFDSNGGIGNKPRDVIAMDPWVTGYFTARVPMLEILCAGGRPLMMIGSFSVEMDPIGEALRLGIQALAREAGFPELPMRTRSEENVATVQSGLGVAIIGVVSRPELRVGSSRVGDLVAVSGIPKDGPWFHIAPEDPEILSIQDLLCVRRHEAVHDMVPVGSRGIAFERGELSRTGGLEFRGRNSMLLEDQSAGPSSCVVFSVAGHEAIEELSHSVRAPLTVIGEFTESLALRAAAGAP